MDTFCHWLDFFRQRSNGSHLHIGTIFVCNLTLHINITVTNKIELNSICCVFIYKCRCSIHLDIFSVEIFTACCGRSVIKDCLNITLKIGNKSLVAFACNNRQHIDIVDTVTTAFGIHAITMLVYTKTQTTTNFLTLCCLAVRMFQRANLENIRIIPAFTQCGVRENKSCWLFKGKQAFFILQNQIIGGNIIRKFTATLQLTVNAVTGLFINAEISLVYSRNITASGFQIFLIRGIKYRSVLVQHIQIFLLKHLSIFSKDFIAISIILTILGNFINKE